MPIGELLDQWEIYKQFAGLVKPKKELNIDMSFHAVFNNVTSEIKL